MVAIAHITAKDGLFNHIRQVAPMWTFYIKTSDKQETKYLG